MRDLQMEKEECIECLSPRRREKMCARFANYRRKSLVSDERVHDIFRLYLMTIEQ